MNEKAVVYLIFFAGLILLSKFTSRWLWNIVCKSAGKTTTDIMEYRIELRGSDNTPKKVSAWLVANSKNPTRTRKLLTIYQCCTLPSVICLNLSIISLFTHIFDSLLDIAAFAVIGINMLIVIIGIFYKNKYE